MTNRNHFKDVLFGVAVGDALGVPVEFLERGQLRQKPVKGMTGFGTYNLPPGTWSDDSALTFCLAEALTQGFDLQTIANNFVLWLYDNYWTPRGTVFDVGMVTREAINNLLKGVRPDLAGRFDSRSNGNGSLMRILPLLFYIKDKPVNDRYEITRQVSSLTHGHVRSSMACFYYLEFARCLLLKQDKVSIYHNLKTEVGEFFTCRAINPLEVDLFARLLQADIQDLPEASIHSSGYVLHTLEASIWCLMTTDSYSDAVLKAVNLGNDTDTTGAVTGGLAGLLYGFETIPPDWVGSLAKLSEIDDLAWRMGMRLGE